MRKLLLVQQMPLRLATYFLDAEWPNCCLPGKLFPLVPFFHAFRDSQGFRCTGGIEETDSSG